MIEFRGGSGDSVADAVEIHGAVNELDGVRAEYRYLAEKLGERGKDWDLVMQALLEVDGKHYDRMDVALADGTRTTVYFDISAFFGRL